MAHSTILKGRYFKAGSSRSSDARLSGTPDNLVITGEANGESIRVTLREISDRLGSVARKIHFTDGSVFESSDHNAIDAFFQLDRRFFSRLSHLETTWKFILPIFILTLLLIAGIVKYGLPIVANIAALVTPSSAMSLIDIGALDVVDRTLFSESSVPPSRQKDITALLNELGKVSGQLDPPLKLLFRDGGLLGANAIALPGGTVVITDQLIELAENDDEIAGVLAHEIGHVKHRHALKQIYRVLGVAFIVTLIGGDSGQLVEDIITQATLLESLSYSRHFEAEADRYSVDLMMTLGKNPMAFIDLLDRMVPHIGKDGETSWLSTHPSNQDRRTSVQGVIQNQQRR